MLVMVAPATVLQKAAQHRSRPRIAQSKTRRRAGDAWLGRPAPHGFAISIGSNYGFRPMSLFCADAFISPLEVEAAVNRALEEDLGRAGDVTSIATVPEETRGRAIVVARKPGVVSGLPFVEASFRRLSPEIEIAASTRDGAAIAAGAKLMTIEGNARAILSAERTALNFIGHMSGIATATAEFVKRIAHTKARIICTRKTTPGLRAVEKYAIRCGGGYNHRFGLDDAMLIKDNHIAVAGGISAVLKRAKAAAGHLVKIEIEVDSLEQLEEVLTVGLADVVLIDNFDLNSMRRAVAMVAGRLVIEASGGITLASAAAIAETGVDYLSSGSLTHSVQNLDIGLDIEM
jgi:nicotinate-nucleotide pyrophosphorylase (carboxylating)